MLVRDLMTAGVLSVSPTVPVSFIVELLAERALPGVPVIDTGEVLVGMVTESDRWVPASTTAPCTPAMVGRDAPRRRTNRS